jgi:hypothetical protein
MLGYYDKASDWGLEVCEQTLNEDGECPGEEVKLTFPANACLTKMAIR